MDRYRGSLVGLACGDALGTTLEFCRGEHLYLTDIIGGGPHNLAAGEWTDDTSMALCLGISLLQCNGFDAIHQLRLYWKWFDEGYLSSNGKCFDIGITTRTALYESNTNPMPYPGEIVSTKDSAGNGSLMRLASIPLFFKNHDDKETLNHAKNSSRTTHGAYQSVDSCVYYTSVIIGILEGKTKDEVLSDTYWDNFSSNCDREYPLCDEVLTIAHGSFIQKPEDEILTGGYVIETMEAALWAFYSTTSFEEGLIKLVNKGFDADTTGAVYGQLAGAYYGYSGIPGKWISKISFCDFISLVADELYYYAENNSVSDSFNVLIGTYDRFYEVTEPIFRKLQPGPKMYKSTADADAEIDSVKKEFLDDTNAIAISLWNTFENITLPPVLDTLAKRRSRPLLPFA
eukprot:TRINITY_DN9307_c0_g1_i1.p1 TRINITY_DN9307_c0_g1~~TRINITY_DN9307_c0_g1_i1.p1  ORF type:complete len:401 (-),score=85.51 TRINITY_DN9307_c0_g1_i1:30-1232(-)